MNTIRLTMYWANYLYCTMFVLTYNLLSMNFRNLFYEEKSAIFYLLQKFHIIFESLFFTTNPLPGLPQVPGLVSGNHRERGQGPSSTTMEESVVLVTFKS